uniref:Uncharacterized protein n=1 Tax=viral metagenome TaxID=1070528 RepID=A0A6C0HS18_9ZZZZ
MANDGCLTKNYNPVPARLWERSSGKCSFIYEIGDSKEVFVPYFNKIVPVNKLAGLIKMLYKGNVLRYPSNASSSAFTKKMLISRIYKGLGSNRKKGWSSQTDSVTSPNTNYLERREYSIISNNANGEIQLPECTQPIIPANDDLPKPALPVIDIIDPPFPVDNKPAINNSNNFPIVPVKPVINRSIVTGGRLIYCSRENICTGTVKNSVNKPPCFPTSDSDVPGPIINLCYPKNFPIFIPSAPTTYTATSSKWPINGITTIPARN